MSRVFTILVILGLIAVVALVPQMGSEEPGEVTGYVGPDLGEGYAYKPDTLRRFGLLLRDSGWTLADPPRNSHGMLEVAHEKTGLSFVLIPAGRFRMGALEEEGNETTEGPVHTVAVSEFLISKTECTQQAWEAGGGRNNSFFRGSMGPESPVERVEWRDCHDWCDRNGLRLPSESEWEYACRAGTSTPFSTGMTLTTDQANYDGAFPHGDGPAGEFRNHTVAAGSLPPNPWGLHEMHGNIWEWCEDTWHDNYEGAPTDGSPWTDSNPIYRVFRGGAWLYTGHHCRSAKRYFWLPVDFQHSLGFRPAADLPSLDT